MDNVKTDDPEEAEEEVVSSVEEDNPRATDLNPIPDSQAKEADVTDVEEHMTGTSVQHSTIHATNAVDKVIGRPCVAQAQGKEVIVNKVNPKVRANSTNRNTFRNAAVEEVVEITKGKVDVDSTNPNRKGKKANMKTSKNNLGTKTTKSPASIARTMIRAENALV